MPRFQSGILALAAFVAGCRLPSATPASVALPAGSWIGRFASPSVGGTPLRGNLRLVPGAIAGTMRAEFDLQFIATTARMPWAIRSGRCGETSAVLLTNPAVPQIEGRADQTATLRTTVNLRLEEGRDYHIAILLGPHETATTAACGALTPII